MTLGNSLTPCFDHDEAAPGAVRASAEWIAEAPATGNHLWPLTNFGTVSFSSAVANGSSLGGLTNDKITMVKAARPPFTTITQALPSAITGGDSFTVTYQPS